MENMSSQSIYRSWLTGVILFVLGACLGALLTYYFADIKAASDAKIAYNFVSDQTQAWKELITESSLALSLEGTIIDIKEGVGQFDNPAILGRQIALQNGTTLASVFVREDTAYEGTSLKNQSDWNEITVSDLKVGDKINVKLNAVLTQNVSPDSFYGWWVFRYTQ